jgi:hypothetical protein
MAHFAELDENNVVLRILVIDNGQEGRGQEFLSQDLGLGGRWEKTSYNTCLGIYYNPENGQPSSDQTKSYRKNYAGIGFTFDETRDAFIPPKPFESWILNENTCSWEAPIPMPIEGLWIWNEEIENWAEQPPAPSEDAVWVNGQWEIPPPLDI